MTDPEYESLKKLPHEALLANAAGSGANTRTEKAKLLYHEWMLEKQHEYAKQQIELQHKLNMKLLVKQLRWIKFSAVLNAIAIIVGVLLGWFLSEINSAQALLKKTQETIQSQNISSTLVTHSLYRNDKVP